MTEYVRNRLLLVVPTMIGATLAVFLLLRLLPGDVALMTLLGPEREGYVDPAKLTELREKLGTDKPIYEQYVKWVWGLAHFDFGTSLISGRPVADELARRFPVTFELATGSALLAAVLGIPAGVLMALRRDTFVDHALRLVTIGGLAIPSFFVATSVTLLLVMWFNWVPPVGYASFLEDPWRNVQQVFLPVLIMGYAGGAVLARMTRSTMLEVLTQDYMRTARAKGLAEASVTVHHALKNAMLPTLTFLGVIFVGALNGTVVMEDIFVIPGIGSGLVDAIFRRDYPVIQGTIMILVAIVLFANLLIDLVYTRLDPRISLE